ncbi:hypothetical protein RvY_16265 [Ramazzottius varieornatus]|uniref:Uncharacterized protein n=1 Tax=Ramazzottius varieornatus TaxID=947166 RepID=A0A1D1W4B9_RAMVA|nr:hypothetical protein RvY_16265 [Ramazzottius varieornatus]
MTATGLAPRGGAWKPLDNQISKQVIALLPNKAFMHRQMALTRAPKSLTFPAYAWLRLTGNISIFK